MTPPIAAIGQLAVEQRSLQSERRHERRRTVATQCRDKVQQSCRGLDGLGIVTLPNLPVCSVVHRHSEQESMAWRSGGQGAAAPPRPIDGDMTAASTHTSSESTR
jgi:hypothetical protein